MADTANIVYLLLAKPFDSLPYKEKLRIKQQGRSTPKIDMVQKVGKGNRSFQLFWYGKISWLTVSAVTNKMYSCNWACHGFSSQSSAGQSKKISPHFTRITCVPNHEG
jgi:hypothetical protein